MGRKTVDVDFFGGGTGLLEVAADGSQHWEVDVLELFLQLAQSDFVHEDSSCYCDCFLDGGLSEEVSPCFLADSEWGQVYCREIAEA